jgi:hypothetical protein
MIQLTFHSLGGIQTITRPALYLPVGRIRARFNVRFSTKLPPIHIPGLSYETLVQPDRRRPILMVRGETRLLNETLFDVLAGDPAETQAAIDAVNNFTRLRMREDGFFRRIMPPVPITNDALDRSILNPALRPDHPLRQVFP